MTVNDLIDAFGTSGDLPTEDRENLLILMAADPCECSEYAVWIGKQYMRRKIGVGDVTMLRIALNLYNDNKEKLPHIKEIKNLFQLIDCVKGMQGGKYLLDYIFNCDRNTERVYEDDEWTVYVPHTFEACRRIGADTRWGCSYCGSYGYKEFKRLHKGGKFYINIRKSNGEKIMFDFNDDKFVDAKGLLISFIKAGFNQSMIDFYKKIDPYFIFRVNFDYLYGFDNGYSVVRLNGLENFINTKGELLSPNQWFDEAKSFGSLQENYAKVCINKKTNYINTHGNLLCPNHWFDLLMNFRSIWLGVIDNNMGEKDKWYIIKEGSEPIMVDTLCKQIK